MASVSPGAEECWIDLGGHRLRYLKAGSGPNLVLIHGLLGYSFSWRFNIPELSRHFTVYAPDLLGVGFSERVPGLDCRLRVSAERMLRFLDELEIESADVLGTSHGGGIAVHMAAREREAVIEGKGRIRRLILVAPVNPWSPHGRLWARIVASGPGCFLFRNLFPHVRPVYPYFHARMYGDKARIPSDSAEGYRKPLRIRGTVDTLLKIADCWNSDLDALKDALAAIANMPTLLIWGDRDRAVPVTSAQDVAAQFRGAELVIMKGAGHLPYEERPEEFNRILQEFLER